MKNIEQILKENAEDCLTENLSIYKFNTSIINSEVKIMIELDKLSDKNGSVNIEDCQKYSKKYSLLLDPKVITNEIPRYTLEVSSAGIEREINVHNDLLRFQHQFMKVEYLDKNNNLQKYVLKYQDKKDDEIYWSIPSVKWNIKQGIVKENKSKNKKLEDNIVITINQIQKINLYFDFK